MKSDDTTYYLVYRTSDDRHGGVEDFYGWTNSKTILNAFLKQRNKSKYITEKITIDADLSGAYSKKGLVDTKYLELDKDLMIDILPIKSCQSGDIVKLFTTNDEKIRITNDIDAMFDELRSFDRMNTDNIKSMVDTYSAIKDKYTDALVKIGYQPMEVEYMYDSVEDIKNYVNYGLGYSDNEDDDILNHSHNYTIYKSIVYSLESVIKVLKDELM